MFGHMPARPDTLRGNQGRGRPHRTKLQQVRRPAARNHPLPLSPWGRAWRWLADRTSMVAQLRRAAPLGRNADRPLVASAHACG